MEKLYTGDFWASEKALSAVRELLGEGQKLDAPMLDQPTFGVMDNVLDLNGTRYCVIDWLRRASSEELPAGQEAFGEIGAQLRCLNRRDWTAAKDQFLQIFVQRRKKAGRTPAD